MPIADRFSTPTRVSAAPTSDERSTRVELRAIGPDGFLPEAELDALVRKGWAVRASALVTLYDGRVFELRDAVRVLGRRNGDTDPYGFTGRADPIRELLRRGAQISGDTLRLGPAVYDIEYGYLATLASTR